MKVEDIELDLDECKELTPKNWEEYARSTKEYFKRRYKLKKAIAIKFGNGDIECFKENCSKNIRIECHHQDEKYSRTDLSGWKHMKKLIQHFNEGKKFKLFCTKHHKEKHESYNLNSIDERLEETDKLLEKAKKDGVFGGL